LPTQRIQISFFILLLGFTSCGPGVVRPPLEILERDLPYSELRADDPAWHRSEMEIPNFGYVSRTIWLRFPVENTQSTQANFILEVGAPWMDRIEFYMKKDDSVIYGASGLRVDESRAFFHRHPAFGYSLSGKEKNFIYLRAQTEGLLSLPVRVWGAQDFANKIQMEYAIHGLYFGTIASLFLYNLALFFFVRDRAYLSYCAYLIAVFSTYMILGGFAKQFFAHDDAAFLKPAMLMSGFAAVGAVCVFNRQFLSLSQINKRLDYGILALAAISGAGFFLSPFLPFLFSVRFLNLFLPVATISLIGSAIYCAIRGVHQSRYFLIAWIALAVGTLIEFTTKFGFLPMSVPGRFGAQIGTVAEVILFSVALGRRIRSLSEEKTIAQDRLLALERDLQLARNIQNRILPSHNPSLASARLHVSYNPLQAVGGDFYDFHEKDDRHFGLLIADVTGHGVAAALDSSTVKIAFRQERIEMESPGNLLANMNFFLKEFVEYRFVSAIYAYFDLDSMIVKFASAGHPPAMLLRQGKARPLQMEGMLLGVFGESIYDTTELALEPGDRLLFYTDGLIEQLDLEGGDLRILGEFAESLSGESPERFHATLLEKLRRKRIESSDDITLLTLDIGKISTAFQAHSIK